MRRDGLSGDVSDPLPAPTPERWQAVDAYLSGLFVGSDEALDAARADQDAAGLPPIEVAAVHAKLLSLLVRMSGARRVLEIGTLGGYSTIVLARAVGERGSVVSLEAEPRHAAVARRNLERAAVAARVRVEVGIAAEVLPMLTGPFDFVFIDADKESTTLYLEHAARLARPGAVVVVDNAVRAGRVADPAVVDAQVDGMRRGLAMLADDPRFDATAVQTLDAKGWDGVAIAIVGDSAGPAVGEPVRPH